MKADDKLYYHFTCSMPTLNVYAQIDNWILNWAMDNEIVALKLAGIRCGKETTIYGSMIYNLIYDRFQCRKKMK